MLTDKELEDAKIHEESLGAAKGIIYNLPPFLLFWGIIIYILLTRD